MKRKIISVLFTLVLVLSFSLIPAVPAAAVDPVTIEVSQPIQVTNDSLYERGQSIVYDGTNYWLFYGRSATVTAPYATGNPDVHDYVVYYKKATTIAGLASDTATPISGVTNNSNGYLGETGAAFFGGEVWAFATIDVGPTAELYGWWTSDGGGTWNEVGPIISGLSDGQGHHDEVAFGGELWIVEGSGSITTMHSATPKTGSSWSTPLPVASLTGGLVHFFVDGSDLYLAINASGMNYIYKYNSGTTAWDWVDDNAPPNKYDPTLFKVGSSYVFAQAPWDGTKQYILQWSGATLDNTFFNASSKMVTEGAYGSNPWVDMWPIGFTDQVGDSYLFFTSERNPGDPSSEIDGNIWYLPVDWDVTNDHYTYIQEAIDAATSTTINVAPGTYNENIDITKRLTIQGAGSGSDPSSNTIITAVVGNHPTIQIKASGASVTERLTIRDLRVTGATGSGNPGSGIEFNYSFASSFVTIENVTSTGNQGHGINADVSVATMEDIRIINCNSSNNGGTGFNQNSYVYIDSLTITNCNMDSNAGLGTCFEGPLTGLNLSGGMYNNNGDVGIYGTRINDFAVQKDVILDGFTANGNKRGLVLNKFYGPFTISNATVSNNTKEGIAVAPGADVSGLTFSNITAENNPKWNIWIIGYLGYSVSDILIDNVTVTGSTGTGNGYGIRIYSIGSISYPSATNISNVSITGSRITGNSQGIALQVNNPLYATLTGVSIVGNEILNNTGPTGISVSNGAAAGNEAHYNEIVGNGMGISNADPDDVFHAEYNWWGDVSGPYHPTSWDYLSTTITNPDGNGDEVTDYVLYEPWIGQGGMVTGGGWIHSPAGAYTASPELEGKATFGFASMYKKGADVPTGKTVFDFHVADLKFHSNSYEWLVIAGDNARFKGVGTINGMGEYRFMLWAGDKDQDTFRIKIWTEENNVETVIYDNGMHQDIAGGNIVVHKK